MARADGPEAHEGLEPRVDHPALDREAADGIRPIEHQEAPLVFRGGPHGEAHGRKVGVVPAPYVLDVEDQGIEPAQVLIARREGGEILAVEGVLGDAGARIPRVRDFLEILHVAADAVLRAEQRDELPVLTPDAPCKSSLDRSGREKSTLPDAVAIDGTGTFHPGRG